jgi:16S rRNA (guanine527-N7)-methyltransferase
VEFYEILNRACSSGGLSFDESKYHKFIQYKDMIKEWNQKVNITAITEDSEIIKKHFIDSIKIFKFLPLVSAKSIIDIGTGGGFPGIPIKIMNEDKEVVLLDSLNKRIRFLDEVINTLQLPHISTIHGRAEDFAQEVKYREKFDVAVSRAVANLTTLSELCIPYVKVNGYFVAMKGPSVEQEIIDAKNALSILGGKIEDIIQVSIEDSDLKHNLVIVKKIKSTPKTYPRQAGTASKNPLK